MKKCWSLLSLLCLLFLIPAGCSHKIKCLPNENCHGFSAPWKKPKVCRASIYTSNSSGIFLAEQGTQEIELFDKVILLVPSDALFEPNSAEFTANAYPILEALTRFLSLYPHEKIQIGGHTDPLGSFKHKEKISTQQATAVTGYLWAHGVEALPLRNRVTFSGNGSNQPIATNKKIHGMELNRRIEIVISDPPPETTDQHTSVAVFLKNKKTFTK